MFTTITKAKQNYDQIDSPYKKSDKFANFEAMMPIHIILLPLSTFWNNLFRPSVRNYKTNKQRIWMLVNMVLNQNMIKSPLKRVSLAQPARENQPADKRLALGILLYSWNISVWFIFYCVIHCLSNTIGIWKRKCSYQLLTYLFGPIICFVGPVICLKVCFQIITVLFKISELLLYYIVDILSFKMYKPFKTMAIYHKKKT